MKSREGEKNKMKKSPKCCKKHMELKSVIFNSDAEYECFFQCKNCKKIKRKLYVGLDFV